MEIRGRQPRFVGMNHQDFLLGGAHRLLSQIVCQIEEPEYFLEGVFVDIQIMRGHGSYYDAGE
jgi:hypothetical protein